MSSNGHAAEPTANGIDILIAEDSRIQSRMLQKNLTAAGFAVRAAENGRKALDLIRERPPTLIISDIEMPEMNGYELCEAVKGDPELRRIPLVLLSTLSEPEDIIRGLHVGADNYVTKPYQTEFLLGRVSSLLETPLGDADGAEETLEVNLAGKSYTVKAGRQQVLNLLISTFENAVAKNGELLKAHEEVSLARDRLTQQNRSLEDLNGKLESSNSKMTRALDAAAKIQQSLLPQKTPETDAATFAWRYRPCDELAGDFLNVFRLDDDHVALFVVDVSGHGVASSLLAVTIGRVLQPQGSGSTMLFDADGAIRTPVEVVAELNRRFPMEDQGELYFTILYGVLSLSTGRFDYTNGGHPPLLHVPADSPPVLVPSGGFNVGTFDEDIAEYDALDLTLSTGDRLFLVSDGIPEGMGPEMEQYGDGRILAALATHRGGDLDTHVAGLFVDIQDWCNRQDGPRDDISILAVEMR